MTTARNRSQPAYLTGSFEVTGDGNASQSGNTGFRTVQSGLNCSGIDGSMSLEHPIMISAYSSANVGLTAGEMYGLKLKLIASNDGRPPHGIHELSHNVHLGNAEAFPGNLIDNTGISSIGVITNRRTIQEPAHGGKPTTVVEVRHTDWDPISGTNVEFKIEYWCRPVRNLVRCQNLFQLGREVTLNGFVTGVDQDKHMIQVDLYAVSVATGHENINAPTVGGVTAQSTTTKAGRVRLPRIIESITTARTRNPSTALPQSSAFNKDSSAGLHSPQGDLHSVDPSMSPSPSLASEALGSINTPTRDTRGNTAGANKRSRAT
ncbi:hypothetical protein DFH28DRAFT_928259 [Melampsora americana]|nr:hypothetical protein DFH28DRAFT_928259 [Melampsora americana]